jgi:hypothetical protein
MEAGEIKNMAEGRFIATLAVENGVTKHVVCTVGREILQSVVLKRESAVCGSLAVI